MPPSAEEARRLLCALGEHVRDLVVASRGMDMAAVAGETVADTIYAIDRVADDALVQWFEEHWPDVLVVSEGLDEPVLVGGDRGLDRHRRHHRRHARPHVRQAVGLVPGRGGAAGRRSGGHRRGGHDRTAHGQAGRGRPAERHPRRRPAGRARRPAAAGEPAALDVRPSAATDLEHSFSGLAKFFLPGKPALAALEAELFRRLGEPAGLRRRVPLDRRAAPRADHGPGPLRRRPAPARRRTRVWPAIPTTSARPCCSKRWAAWSPIPWGDPLAVPLDNVTPVAWVGYANEALAARIGPVLAELVDGLRAG